MASSKRRRLRVGLGVAGLIAALAAAGLWLRDSELVGVEQVSVTGVDGPEAEAIRAALIASARDMTTLHVRPDELTRAVEPYPVVRRLRADADFPHRLRIAVDVRRPVAALLVGGHRTAVAGDGTLLRGNDPGGLPAVGAASTPRGDRVRDEPARGAVRLLAAAPHPLRVRVQRVFLGARGLTASLRDGPKIYFGQPRGATAKWAAAARVLADEPTQGAEYVDVRLPERPAVGGLARLENTQPPL